MASSLPTSEISENAASAIRLKYSSTLTMYATSLGLTPYLPISDRAARRFAPVSAPEPSLAMSVTPAESAAWKDPAPSVPAPPQSPAWLAVPFMIEPSIARACARARADRIQGRTLTTICSSVSFAMNVPEIKR